MTILPYDTPPNAAPLRRAGLVLTIWASVTLSAGALVAYYGSYLIYLTFELHAEIFSFFPIALVLGLPVLVGGIALIGWSVSTLKRAVTLLRGRRVDLVADLRFSRIAELTACLATIPLLCAALADLLNSGRYIIFLYLGIYLLLPLALTLTRRTLASAETPRQRKPAAPIAATISSDDEAIIKAPRESPDSSSATQRLE